MFLPLKSYFEAQDMPPKKIIDFFNDPFAEIYLWFVHSLLSIFQTKVEKVQSECNSVLELRFHIIAVQKMLEARQSDKFIPFKVKELFKTLRDDGTIQQMVLNKFTDEALNVYQSCSDYLKKWTCSLEEFAVFEWMHFNLGAVENLRFDDLCPCIAYLQEKGISLDDVHLFDEFQALKNFLKTQQQSFFNKPCHLQWVDFFNHNNCPAEVYSQLLNICQFIFAIPGSNSSVERVFSLIKAQWTNERNRFNIESVKGILIVKYNFKNYSCEEFYKYLLSNPEILKKISNSDKYIKGPSTDPSTSTH